MFNTPCQRVDSPWVSLSRKQEAPFPYLVYVMWFALQLSWNSAYLCYNNLNILQNTHIARQKVYEYLPAQKC